MTLIERLEALSGPDWEVDALIARALGWEPRESDKAPLEYWVDAFGTSHLTVPNFTGSIDAAMTLVPEGYDWSISKIDGIYSAALGPKDTFNTTEDFCVLSSAAIALCIAAIKAIEDKRASA